MMIARRARLWMVGRVWQRGQVGVCGRAEKALESKAPWHQSHNVHEGWDAPIIRSFKSMPGPRTCRRKMIWEKLKRRNRVQSFQNLIDSQKALRRVLILKNALANQPHCPIQASELGRQLDAAGTMMQRKVLQLLRKYPCIFNMSESPLWDRPFVQFTKEALALVDEEKQLIRTYEPVLTEKVTRILMMTVDHKLPLDHLCLLERELGLPFDFRTRVAHEHPEFFKVVQQEDGEYLEITEWDDSLAVTMRELNQQEKPLHSKLRKKLPYGFRLFYAKGHRPGMEKTIEMNKWQQLPFISPYANPEGTNPMCLQYAKHTVAVVHEFLSLTLEKMTTVEVLDVFRKSLRLPCRLYYFLLKHYAIFYVAEKGKKHAVFLKEAYRAIDHPKKVAHLIEKVPQLELHERYTDLMRAHWDLPSTKIPGLGRKDEF